ncbi:MAG: DUF1800 domain-containing protein [Vicinamibacterales bacterium]
MAQLAPEVEHLYRRAGFGLSAADRQQLDDGQGYRNLVDGLLVFDPSATDVDGLIGTPGHVGITTSGPFSPNVNIAHARQRWLFRMVHSPAPLQEKMALVWHQHFATAYSKINGTYGGADGTRLMAGKASEDPVGQQGQIETLRGLGLGRFEDLLIAMARDPAMLIWLDGRTNVKAVPQENFGRELMELFTFGVDHYVETDVYAAARAFTGWNLRIVGTTGLGTAAYSFTYNASQHDVASKDFSFPLYSRGTSNAYRIPARSGAAGVQDGLDLIHALAFHPETARRLAGRFWTWFVSETEAPHDRFVQSIAKVYLDNGTSIRAVMRAVLTSPEFQDARQYYQRYAWPAEFVVRSLKEVGYLGFSVNDALTPMLNMGQQLLEPPDVNGWELGPPWFSTGGMLARMNFASQLATNQRGALRDAARPFNSAPEQLIEFAIGKLSLPPLDTDVSNTLLTYIRAGGAWTGSDTQLLAKSPGVIHLLAGSGEYQFV